MLTPTTALAASKLKTPTGLKLVSTTSNSISIKWNKVSGAKKYTVQYSAYKNFKDTKKINVSGTKATVKKLTPNKTYYLRVRSIKKGVTSSKYTKAIRAKTKKTVEQTVKGLISGHYLYWKYQSDSSDIYEYAFAKDGTFTEKGLLFNGNSVTETLSLNGTYTVKGNEVLLNIKSGTVNGSSISPYKRILYYAGNKKFASDLYVKDKKTFGRIHHYQKNKLTEANLKSYCNSLKNNEVSQITKKDYYSFDSVLDSYFYSNTENHYADVYYNYLVLNTKYGKKKALVVTTYMSAYLQNSIVYAMKSDGKLVKIQRLPGQITRYTKDRKTILTYNYAGSGDGQFNIMNYSSKNGKYQTGTKYAFNMSTRDSVYSKVENKTKNFVSFDATKHKLL